MIPSDTVKSLEILTDPIVPNTAGVSETNAFVFPFTKFSADHASGWHSMRNVVNAIETNKPNLLTATKVRH